MQTIELSSRFNSTYWNTACLIVDSGMSTETSTEKKKATDYAKVAKAIGHIHQTTDIKVAPLDINRSLYEFIPDPAKNQILFGLKGVTEVGDLVIKDIVENRPYTGFKDFCRKTCASRLVTISLIKGGAFDKFHDRKTLMGYYLLKAFPPKVNLTLQNMRMLVKDGYLPDSLSFQRKVYECNRFIKSRADNKGEVLTLEERPANFITENFPNLPLDTNENGECTVSARAWKDIYDKEMGIVREWLQTEKTSIMEKVNKKSFCEAWQKYASGTISSWEMDAMCYYHHDHELIDVNLSQYGIQDFFSMPKNPPPDPNLSFTNKSGVRVNLVGLTHIAGTCIAKDSNKGLVSLLTTTGVVTVNFRNEYFSLFDKQIKDLCSDGKRHVVEKSWFSKGSMIIVQGHRRDDNFMAKKYTKTGGHQLYRISEIQGKDLVITSDRYTSKTAELEEAPDEW